MHMQNHARHFSPKNSQNDFTSNSQIQHMLQQQSRQQEMGSGSMTMGGHPKSKLSQFTNNTQLMYMSMHPPRD